MDIVNTSSIECLFFLFTEEVNENYGTRFEYKDFIHQSYEPLPFKPIWRSGEYLEHANTKLACTRLSRTPLFNYE